MKYRIELDGLRAIAVLAVIFYHANINLYGFPFFQGGLYGVDIFFVLSGFLITGIVKNQFETESFSFVQFYWRRAKRIIPALLIVLLVSAIVAYLLLLPNALLRFVDSLQSALYFGSNHYFLNEDSYTAPNSVYKPLLHTWSLAVEWQFYVVFPFIYVLLHKCCKRFIFPILLTLTFVSFISAVFLTKTQPDSSFYLLVTRAWEMLLGGLIVYITRDKLIEKTPLIVRQFLPVFALFLIAYSLFFLDHKVPHPSWQTLPAVFGTALFIVFANKDDLVTFLLSKKTPVFIGLISYSLYLWHQPVFAFYRIVKNKIEIRPEQVFLLLFVSMVLAWLTVKFVETPFRKKVSKISLTIALVLIASLFSYSHWVQKNEGQLGRSFMLSALGGLGNDQYFKLNGKVCFNKGIEGACELKSKNKSIVLLGDSHSGRLAEPLYQYAISNKLGFKEFSISNCYGIEGVFIRDRKDLPKRGKETLKKCHNNTRKYKRELENISPAIIVYAIRMDYAIFTYNNKNKKVLFSRIKSQVNKWEAYGHKVVVVYDNPIYKTHIPNTIYRKIITKFDKKTAFEKVDLSMSYQQHLKMMKAAYDFFDSLGDKIERAYAYKALCDEKTGRCIPNDKNDIFYSDKNHLSRQGAQLVFDKEIKPVLDSVIKFKG